MNRKSLVTIGLSTAVLAALSVLATEAISAQDKYSLKVPGGLAFADFKGYENWQLVSISQNGKLMAAILGNPTVIEAFRSGIPVNGKPFPDGSRMAKIHWIPKVNENAPGPPTVPNIQHDVDFMVKDSKRFADSGGWGYAVFDYEASSDTFKPGTLAGTPPQDNDARCGFTCHKRAAARDYVFTEYGKR